MDDGSLDIPRRAVNRAGYIFFFFFCLLITTIMNINYVFSPSAHIYAFREGETSAGGFYPSGYFTDGQKANHRHRSLPNVRKGWGAVCSKPDETTSSLSTPSRPRTARALLTWIDSRQGDLGQLAIRLKMWVDEWLGFWRVIWNEDSDLTYSQPIALDETLDLYTDKCGDGAVYDCQYFRLAL